MDEVFDLRAFLVIILRKWRMLLTFTILVAFLGGCYKVIPGYMDLKNPALLEQQRKQHEALLTSYQNQIDILNDEIVNLQDELKRLDDYKQNSILMKMDPFNKYVSTVDFYIKTDYQILPEMSFQNPNYASQIISAYVSAADSGEMYRYILDNNQNYGNEVRCLQEVVSFLPNYQSQMFTVSVAGLDKEFCDHLIQSIITFLQEKQVDINLLISTHELEVMNLSTYKTMDFDLETKQKENRKRVNEINDELQNKFLELDQLKPPENTTPSRRSLLGSGMKFMILGGLGGLAIGIFLTFFIDMMDVKIRSERDLKRYGVLILGVLPTVRKGE